MTSTQCALYVKCAFNWSKSYNLKNMWLPMGKKGEDKGKEYRVFILMVWLKSRIWINGDGEVCTQNKKWVL